MSIEDRSLRPGQILIAKHKRKEHRAEVRAGEDGKLVYRLKDGREFTSPSAAGSAVMNGTACNGWRFWTPEGQEPAKKATTPKKAAAKAKGASKAKGAAKPKAKPKKGRKLAGGANGEPSVNGSEPVEKPVACGACGEEYASSREAGDHMRDQHGSVEAPGNGSH